jgi:prepilin-type N-terminal cleavage/methylation domain-containing protein
MTGARGFTLLEALVVLVITGLISVVLVQGFGQILATRTRFADRIVGIEKIVVERNLVLEPLRGILPDYLNKPHVFRGEARRLHALTVRPLQDRLGAPVGFTMWLDYDAGRGETVLFYQEEGLDAWELARWEGSVGAFSYRDRTGDWSDRWPLDERKQTPWAVRLETSAPVSQTLIASVMGSHERIVRIEDSPVGSAVRNR